MRPYRCRDCNKRFYRYSRSDHSKRDRLPLSVDGAGRKEQPDALPTLVAQIKEAEMRLEEARTKPGQGSAQCPPK